MVGNGKPRTCVLGNFLDESTLGLSIGVERIQTNDRLNAGTANDVDMSEEIITPLLEKLEIFARINGIKRKPCLDLRRAAVSLKRADGGDENYGIWL